MVIGMMSFLDETVKGMKRGNRKTMTARSLPPWNPPIEVLSKEYGKSSPDCEFLSR